MQNPLAIYQRMISDIDAIDKRLDKMRSNPDLQGDLAFHNELVDLMKEHGKSGEDVITLLDPNHPLAAHSSNGEARARKPRVAKTYTNPHTGESLTTRGGNHKTLKAWKAEYGSATVESWSVREQ